MPAAPLPLHEDQRLVALHSYRILDTPVEPAFEDITRLAAALCGTPIAVVNLIDRGRQWFKSEIGLGVRETPLDTSICAHAILQPDLFIVPDTTCDERFRCNPLVTGEPRLRFYAGAPLRTPEGHALGTICVLDFEPRDLTEAQGAALQALARQAMTQLELRRALTEVEVANRTQRRLMATAGHDLKQPLQVVMLALEKAGCRLSAPSDARLLGQAYMAIDQLSTNLDRLAEASQLGTPAARAEEVDLANLIQDVAQGWALLAERRSVRVRALRGRWFVRSDAGMVRTIVGNLVGNAIKYTPPGGSVLVGCRRAGGAIRIQVTDTGLGIPADQLGTVFEPFRQLNPRQSDGLGMGLAIVRKTAEELGCTVSVTSVVAKGSTFALTFPADACEPRGRDEATPIAARPLGDAAPEGSPAFDREVFDDILTMLGSQHLLQLLERLDEQLTEAFGTGAELGLGRLAREAHVVVSSAGMLGFTALSDACRDLEQGCLGQEPVEPLLARAREARARALLHLREARAQLATRPRTAA